MRRFLLILVLAISAMSCGTDSNKYIVLESGDTLSTAYLVGERRVGEIRRGATLARLNNIYGDRYVKQLKSNEQSDSTGRKIFYIYNKLNHLELIAHTREEIGEDIVNELIIKDRRYLTAEGIGLHSSVGDIRRAYPDATVINYDDMFYIFVANLDLYFGVKSRYVVGYNPDFVEDIPLDSVDGDALPDTMSVSWYSHKSDIFSAQFWQDILSRAVKWLLYEFPSIIFIIVVFVACKRLLTIIVNNIRRVTRKRVEADKSVDNSEVIKRLDTITGIILGLINILMWCILILMLLSKFNINIAPILASAGILGLAVGFGAQELVRDFISGFFILLENQLRTGDMAIINDTMGVVEKIELRTVTLRDSSGVVHIFQNGKINSLSNMTKEWSAIVLEIGVAYKEDIDRVIEIMEEVGAELRASERYGHLMLEDVDIWGLDSFADSAVVIKMVIKTRPMKQWRVKREYQRMLKARFDKENIEIPFPHISLYSGEASRPIAIDIRDKSQAETTPEQE